MPKAKPKLTADPDYQRGYDEGYRAAQAEIERRRAAAGAGQAGQQPSNQSQSGESSSQSGQQSNGQPSGNQAGPNTGQASEQASGNPAGQSSSGQSGQPQSGESSSQSRQPSNGQPSGNQTAPSPSSTPSNAQSAGSGSGEGAFNGFQPLTPEQLQAELRRKLDGLTTALGEQVRFANQPANIARELGRKLKPDERQREARMLKPNREALVVNVDTAPVDEARRAAIEAKIAAATGAASGGLAALDDECRQAGIRLANTTLKKLLDAVATERGGQKAGRLGSTEYTRALKGERDLYTRTDTEDQTSFAVSIAVDVSGSMGGEIDSGDLYRSVGVLTAALDYLRKKGVTIPYEVRLFSDANQNILLKALDDEQFDPHRRARLANTSMGGTDPTNTLWLSGAALAGRPEKKKLLFVLTDGEVGDKRGAAEALRAARDGITGDRDAQVGTFGLFLGRGGKTPESFNELFGGEDNWAAIEHIHALPEQIGAKIRAAFGRKG